MNGGRACGKSVFAVVVLAVFFMNAQAGAASPSIKELREKVRAYRGALETQIMQEFICWLALPNVAVAAENIRKNAEHSVAS